MPNETIDGNTPMPEIKVNMILLSDINDPVTTVMIHIATHHQQLLSHLAHNAKDLIRLSDCHILMTKGILLVLAIFIMLIAPVISEDVLYATKIKVLFNYMDSTNGTGIFSSHNELGSQIKKTCYGSGVFANKMIIGSNQTSYIYQNLSENYYSISSAFAVLANSNMSYAPHTMTIGTSHYAANPLHVKTRLGDKFQIKNYASETSMIQETNYATTIKKFIQAGETTKHSNKGYNFDSGRIAMRLSGTINGTTQVGMVHSNSHDSHYDKRAWSLASVDIDDVYYGTFDLKTNMSLSWPVIRTVSDDLWLPCCFGGWNNMSFSSKNDFGVDTNDVFDCSCYKGITKA